ncbi:MAG TPA: sigma-70 family RNA polymerase sigma factor [Acidimicrobiia bacterium]|nr:sigma-70 family RNA polymerase sigma factor [Acidimicrobiia bacterium]
MTDTSPADNDGVVVEIRLFPSLRAPFVARRIVGSLITSGPRLRAIDASLLAGEITTLVITSERPATLKLVESGRSIRVAISTDEGPIGEPDAIVTALLNRVADRWSADDSLWFEIDLIRRQDLSELPDNDLFGLLPNDRDARDELFERYAGFASAMSRRFGASRQRGTDLEQVALLALVRAIERFDPGVGVKFTSFAGPWISGALKRHLRDHGWSMRVPRSLKDGSLAVKKSAGELAQELGREPTPQELAVALDMAVDDVLEAMLASDAYSLTSLDAPAPSSETGSLGELIGVVDSDLATAEEWPAIEAVLDRLSDREQQILYLRFFEDLTQAEIAPLVGVSQVHVSRLLEKSLERVRNLLEDPAGD